MNAGSLPGFEHPRSTSLAPHPRRLRRVLRSWPLAFVAIGVGRAQSSLPGAPQPQPGLVVALADGVQQAFPPQPRSTPSLPIPGLEASSLPAPRICLMQACTAQPLRSCCFRNAAAFATYLRQNAIHIYTPSELGRLAVRDVVDPFNLLTVGGTSAISVAEDAHSPYGPGFHGWARLSGVTLTEDMTGEFVGTFLIPSIDHQDPHYHREPNAPIPRRVLHCIVQPFWTNTDTGGHIVNYATVAGSVIDEAVDVSYVPYQKTGWGPSAERISLGWANAPIGNFVSEFVPDLANHLNIRVVFIQRIINRVAIEEGGEP